jgi:formamidopyrimidine-DNA glycosylase
MPELPDVECFRRLVLRHFREDRVSHVVVADPLSLEGIAAPARCGLEGHRLRDIGRHGKYLFLDFAEDTVLVMHFGPAGMLCHVPSGQQEPKYVRFRLDFMNGDGLAYVNRRRIGLVRLVASSARFIEQSQLGPDAMDPDFDFAAFQARVSGRKPAIKRVLTDQARLAGIGNTWSDEILFQARLHPAIPAGELTVAGTRTLFRAMRHVLEVAIDRDPITDGFLSRLPPDFILPHRHPGGQCPRCGAELERVSLSGHTSTFCPRCQTVRREPAGGSVHTYRDPAGPQRDAPSTSGRNAAKKRRRGEAAKRRCRPQS